MQICSNLRLNLFVIVMLAIGFLGEEALGLSPYENYLARSQYKRIGLLAAVRTGSEEAFSKVLAEAPKGMEKYLAKAGISDLLITSRKIDGQTWCFAHFCYSGANQEKAGEALMNSSEWWGQGAEYLEPHPRAASDKRIWLRMELICHLQGAVLKKPKKVEKLGLVTGLRPDMELKYRTLHQTNWPGVSDQMVRSNYRHWTTFCVEMGEKLFLFTYFEYVGEDIEADNSAMKADPVTQRWWKHTEPCLIRLVDSESEGNWATMKTLLRIDSIPSLRIKQNTKVEKGKVRDK